MNRLFTFFVLCILASHIYAENTQNAPIRKHTIDIDLGYDYVINGAHLGGGEVIYQYSPANWVDVQFGLQAAMVHSYSALTRADFRYNFHTHHHVELRNQYLYNYDFNNQMQHFNAVLAVAYHQDYVYVAMGVMTNLFSPTARNSRARRRVEPVLFCYDIEGRIFPTDHHWNLALQLTNIDSFMAVSAENPNIILKSNFTVFENDSKGRIDLKLDAGFEHSAVFLPHSQVNGIYVSTGLQWMF